ncbi:MAG TPA: pyridoxamine 5'-phosphate oxidase family protein [Actinomycetota bacterium]|nr:pyridoxamine 5'-phosphate oxidase family protein [Actinomycetota bacterium]
MSPQEVRHLLSLPLNAVLTTNGARGYPHSTAMWFVAQDEDLLMWTYAKSQKSVNLQRDSRCAVLVEEGTAYDELRGVLVRGAVEIITEYDEIARIGACLYDKYTFPLTGVPFEDGPRLEIERQAHKRVGLRLPLEWTASWDHRKLR